MRASMGVPAIFAAIRVDGMLLVDGGVTNNLPIDIAREMGADRLIVVDISSPLRNPSEINNILDVADQLTTMLTTGNTNRQLETLAEQDVLIRPELGDLSSVDFERTDEAIAIGYKAALQADSVLNGFKVDDDQYIVREKPHPPSEKITSIMLDNNSGLNDKLIRNTLDMEHGEELDLDLLEEKLNRVHGLGNFELVGYDLAFEEQGVDLKLMATAKSWGPNYLHMGLDIESDLDNDSRATLLLGYTREEVSDKGAEWTVVVGIGEEPIVQSIWYQPLTYHRDWFFLAAAGYGSEIVSQFEDDEKIAEFGLEVLSAYVGIGYEFGSFAATSVGLRRASGTANLKIGDPAIPDFDFEDGSVVLAFLYDTRDKISFPSQGSLLELEVSASLDVLGADENYQQWILGLGKAFSWGNHNLGLRFSAGGTNGVNNVNSLFRLGGYGKLTGLRRDQLTGNYMAVASAVYYRRFGAIPVLDGYIGSIVEYGGAWQDRDDISADTSIFSAGVFIGADTPIGAIQIGIAHADQGETTAFARIGRVF
jgi:NTE family protein